ncbi:DUF4870 family protein [Paracoccaceae bacterium GXU_MW_L88]
MPTVGDEEDVTMSDDKTGAPFPGEKGPGEIETEPQDKSNGGRSYGPGHEDAVRGENLAADEESYEPKDEEATQGRGHTPGHPYEADARPGMFAAGMQNVRLNYILAALGVLVWPLALIAGIMAFLFREKAGHPAESHYVWQFRTVAIAAVASLVIRLALQSWLGWIVMLALGIWYLMRLWKGWQAQSRGGGVSTPESFGV